MPPYRAEYWCPYRRIWRYDAETSDWGQVCNWAQTILDIGRQVRIVDVGDRVLWPR